MNSEFFESTIGEQITLQRGFDITKNQQVPGKIPVVSSGGISSFHNEFKVKGCGVVLGRKGTLGTVFYLKENFWPHDTSLWVKDFKGNDPRFVYYFFLNISSILKSMDVGAANPALNRNHVHPMSILWTSHSNQKAIAHILGSLDNKIELNRQMNQTLEAMAQALFKSWFVDFDPVIDNAIQAGNNIPDELLAMAEKRSLVADNQKLLSKNPGLAALFPSSFVFNETLGKWIPEGWEVKKLQELVNVKYGKDHKKLEEGDIPCFGSGGIMRYVEKALFETESVLIPRKGSLDNVMYVNKPFWSVDTMFYTEMKQNNFVKYFFNVMNKLNFSEMNEGSAVPSMTTAQLNAMDILHPSAQCLSEFDTLISKYFSKKEGNEIQIETLTKLRDTLLPRLISGKVRVREDSK